MSSLKILLETGALCGLPVWLPWGNCPI